MARCPVCSRDIPRTAPAGQCPQCGAVPSGASTIEAGDASRPDYQLSGRDPLGDARFAPGHIFASRYRIVSLLGRGAMGEVYRADDLRIGRPIALKLLAVPTVREAQVQRFVGEVRLARDITHPNVCRVYDIGEADGWHYLSMEYVDGETLASLLRRIGRMPSEKAMEIARQLCAGLAAAHDVGVLHRDIKPSNIMVDGRGRVRLTDFGLAIPRGQSLRGEVAGTPAYMAPEQLAGDRATERTDLYALGLVLYELFTGRPLFLVRSLDERLHVGFSMPALGAPSLPEIDAAIGDVIRSCLAPDPAARPASALSVAAVLPGGDPLAAALAEGRLLPPDLIAVAGPTGELRPAIAWCLFGLVAVGAFVVAAQIGKATQIQPSAIPKPSEALAERARQILDAVGPHSSPRDTEYWFRAELADGPSPAPNAPLRGIRFVYRESPSHLIAQNLVRLVTETDPPLNVPGMALVTTDAAGLLLRFESVAEPARTGSSSTVPDWTALFDAAGLSLSEFVAVETDRNPSVPSDQQRQWSNQDNVSPVRVTAASLNGRPVYFERLSESPVRYTARSAFSTGRPTSADALMWVAIVLGFGVSAVLARHNLRRGEGDRRGARRLSVFVIGGGVRIGLLRAHHVPVGIEEATFLLGAAGWALVWGAFSWLIYMGLEPHVRRAWPSVLVSWTRLISGRVRDPLVGRDVLIGVLASVAFVVVRFLVGDEPAPNALLTPALESLRSTRQFTSMLVFNTLDSLQASLVGLFFLLLLRQIVRNTWIAAALLSVLFLPISVGGTGVGAWQSSWEVTALGLLTLLMALTVLVRFGLVAFVTMGLVNRMLTAFPLTLDTNAWYVGSSATILLLVGALAAYGCVVSLGSLPVPRVARGQPTSASVTRE